MAEPKERTSLETVYLAWREEFRPLALSLAPPDDVEDLLGEVYLVAKRAEGRFRGLHGERSRYAYLSRLLYRTAARQARRRAREAPETNSSQAPRSIPQPAAAKPQAAEALARALAAVPLSPRARALLYQRLDDVPLSVSAAALGISTGHASKLLADAYQRLRPVLAEILDDNPTDPTNPEEL